MRIAAVMPIKLNNERCPGKNLRLLGGKPLLRYELDALATIREIDGVHVYCSDRAVIPFLPDGARFVQRPAFLDLPTANFTQIFECFMRAVDAEIYVYAHATAPFVTAETMRSCVEAVSSGKYDSAFCARKLQNYLWQDGESLNFDASNLPRTQDLKPIYQETSGVYVFTREVFEKYRRRIGVNPFVREVSLKEAVDIDTPEDFRLAEALVDAEL